MKMKKAGIRATQCHHMTVVKQLSETQDPVIREMVYPQVIEQLQEYQESHGIDRLSFTIDSRVFQSDEFKGS